MDSVMYNVLSYLCKLLLQLRIQEFCMIKRCELGGLATHEHVQLFADGSDAWAIVDNGPGNQFTSGVVPLVPERFQIITEVQGFLITLKNPQLVPDVNHEKSVRNGNK